MNIEVKPCTVIVDGKTVAAYDTVTSATAFRHGIEWAHRQPHPMERSVDAILNKLRINSVIDDWWNSMDADQALSVRAILIKAAIAAAVGP